MMSNFVGLDDLRIGERVISSISTYLGSRVLTIYVSSYTLKSHVEPQLKMTLKIYVMI